MVALPGRWTRYRRVAIAPVLPLVLFRRRAVLARELRGLIVAVLVTHGRTPSGEVDAQVDQHLTRIIAEMTGVAPAAIRPDSRLFDVAKDWWSLPRVWDGGASKGCIVDTPRLPASRPCGMGNAGRAPAARVEQCYIGAVALARIPVVPVVSVESVVLFVTGPYSAVR